MLACMHIYKNEKEDGRVERPSRGVRVKGTRVARRVIGNARKFMLTTCCEENYRVAVKEFKVSYYNGYIVVNMVLPL